jgi:SAM-dependent methyltransferase
MALPPGSWVLDCGCGERPYYPFFQARGLRYVGVDSEPVVGPHLLADGERLPFRAGQFDLAISNQVLEHVRNPKAVVAEMRRVLRPGGFLFVSLPFVWEVHNYPADFWRFSEQGVVELLAGFKLLELEGAGTSLQAILQTLHLWLNRTLSSAALKRNLFRLSNRTLMSWAGRTRDRLLPPNYTALAQKPL